MRRPRGENTRCGHVAAICGRAVIRVDVVVAAVLGEGGAAPATPGHLRPAAGAVGRAVAPCGVHDQAAPRPRRVHSCRFGAQPRAQPITRGQLVPVSLDSPRRAEPSRAHSHIPIVPCIMHITSRCQLTVMFSERGEGCVCVCGSLRRRPAGVVGWGGGRGARGCSATAWRRGRCQQRRPDSGAHTQGLDFSFRAVRGHLTVAPAGSRPAGRRARASARARARQSVQITAGNQSTLSQ